MEMVTSLDMQLYEYAKRLAEKRLREEEAGIEALKNYYKKKLLKKRRRLLEPIATTQSGYVLDDDRRVMTMSEHVEGSMC